MSILWLRNIRRAISFRDVTLSCFSSERQALLASPNAPCLVVLLPLLKEQHNIVALVEHFLAMPYPASRPPSIVLITTEKEEFDCAPSTRTTAQMARELAGGRVHHYHYPEANGVMAHQLNFGITEAGLRGLIDEDTFFAVYNGDSRPEPDTFLEFLFWRRKHPYREVFQQLSSYAQNISTLPEGPRGWILRAAAWWQCRWSLGFELPHTIAHQEFMDKHEGKPIPVLQWLTREVMVYCIGHGLIVSRKALHLSGDFAENCINEDAILGLRFNWKRITIQPLAHFDCADSPRSLSSLVQQKSIWYFGPLQAFWYVRLLNKEGGDARLIALATRLFSHAVYWLADPLIMFSYIAVGLSLGPGEAAVSFIGVWVFLVLPLISVRRYLHRIRLVELPATNQVLLFFEDYIGALGFYFLHLLGALRCLTKTARWLVFGVSPSKPKTEI